MIGEAVMKTLLDKLGYKSGTAALPWRVPDQLAAAMSPLTQASDPAFLLAFVRDRAELAQAAAQVAATYRSGGHLWIAYPKKSGTIRSDLTRDHGWEPIEDLGLLPVTQVAVDHDWFALRFRYRDEIMLLRRRSEQQ
jgi:hypothetical protein